MNLERLNSTKCFDGLQQQFAHQSEVLDCKMRFSIFLPQAAEVEKGHRFPAVYWLSGLTCTDENFSVKAGAQRAAAELGIALVIPDTSPRGGQVPDDPDFALGQGAGFYLNATQAPWSAHYRMYDYIVHELPALIERNFPVSGRRGIAGHSMGGHGALVIGLRNPQSYTSISVFSPISNPMACPWGEKAFNAYLGADRSSWKDYDAADLLRRAPGKLPVLVSQGESDPYLEEQLKPHALEAAAEASGYPLTMEYHAGYDHSYFFVSSFIEQHLRFHADYLLRNR
ncbi:S-formylglutathione hydrolase [Microbulbifer thermotolerans]|uniref:S-formylglutathione hydrolase n=1 Tax=Microbulbifer thermotolerans TaxID=252514 RepID=A0A143HJT8_MICTH|nr:S-formylglutathione hydrolase [Microbulbifer thermotolerans]AMX01766.1 S-formylglutathione hydrolase [Microbulbifer thermotolerans]MCX2793413.1 S-formylglutathione hydrolase [Microbulbifer thermotolerans]MCX2830556.1 S-formylglutathione hydrolase [Microbulbifer thermotolerans]MCX2834897.1 S-formylglutathione hydrolase [Microbulbifer thermotolerans]